MIAPKTDKQALLDWEEFLQSIRNSTPVDQNETEEEKAARIKRLEKEGNQEEWFAYYFPKYAFAKPADFQKKSSRRFLKAKRMYQRRAWARGLAKSTRRMMELFYKAFAQKVKLNMLLCSKTEENAARLLGPYRANLEANARLINDYGEQQRPGKWTETEFTTLTGHTFRAVGAGQNPRGARNEEMRINVCGFDDIDDDEVCRNIDRLDQVWSWAQEAVIPTVDISRDYWIFIDNNIIAEDSVAVRAAAYADDVELVNIRDVSGVSSWPEKNSEGDIDYMLGTISYEAGQKEYFNNPMSQGKTFKEMKWGKCPPLKSLRYALIYADPATSNKDKPTLKSKASNSMKAVFLLGRYGPDYFVYTGYLDNMGGSMFIDCLYACNDYVGNQTMVKTAIENNGLQNPHYEQVILPGVNEKAKTAGYVLSITPDTRDKGDKWIRVEFTLEPINRMGNLILNIEEKDNPHMKRLEAQFKAAKATSKLLDGPDCIEGGVFILKTEDAVANSVPETFARPVNPKRL